MRKEISLFTIWTMMITTLITILIADYNDIVATIFFFVLIIYGFKIEDKLYAVAFKKEERI